jgi:adenylate kinase
VRLLLIGAPGAGKGTQAVHISDHFGIPHISSGDLLRQHIAEATSIGRAAAAYVKAGDLVPDQIVMNMLFKPVKDAGSQGGYVLDGFPRTVEQAEIAYRVAEGLGVAVQVAIHLDVEQPELIRRLLARGRGAEDTEDVIAHRLDVFEQRTRPLLDYYARRETLVTVNGNQPVDDVTDTLLGQLSHLAMKKQ